MRYGECYMKFKKQVSLLLASTVVISNLSFVQAYEIPKETPNVSISTLAKSDSKKTSFETNLEGIQENDRYKITENGLTGISDGATDAFILSETVGDNFVYEADVTFNERRGAAALIFRESNDLDNKNMYVANINGENGEVRLFKFENNKVLDLSPTKKATLAEDNQYHLKVTVIDKHMVYYVNDKLVINTADYTMNTKNEDSHYGQNDAIDSGKMGLLTWNGNVTYQNVTCTPITSENSPQLTDLSVESIGGKVDKQIQFAKGQYVYITYLTNDTTEMKVNPEIDNDSEIVATDEDGNVVDMNHLPITKELNTYTLTVSNGDAKVVYRIRAHKMQPDENYYNEDWRGQYHYSVKDG